MKYTSAKAAKLLKKLNEEKADLLSAEAQSCEFVASIGEDIEDVRPRYDYQTVKENLIELEHKIIKVKHAINLFNTTHTVPGFDMTVDEMLVYIPILREKKAKLAGMKSVLPKTRDQSSYNRSGNIIDYRYANYDIEAVAADHDTVSDELARAQLALDQLNGTAEFDIDV